MAQRVMTFGPEEGLMVQIKWLHRKQAGTGEEATYGDLWLYVGGAVVWGEFEASGDSVPIAWSWIDLLEFLANAWPYLAYESYYPLGLKPSLPSGLRLAAEARWQAIPDDRRREEDEQVYAFEQTHDLARGLQGALAPSVWLLKEGTDMIIASERRAVRRPLAETLETLEHFGDAICARLNGISDTRSAIARASWDGRARHDSWFLAQVVSGRSRQELEALATGSDLLHALEINPLSFQETEALALAGLTRGILSPEQLGEVISRVKVVGRLDTTRLDELSRAAVAALGPPRVKEPYDQGYTLALWFRGRSGLAAAQGRLDIEHILGELNVHLEEITLRDEQLDAFAFWGPRHGPAILINLNRKHASVEGARRATLAHEMCHLLVDRAQALPLADVVNGHAPLWSEQRADAFAAEVLLPRRIAWMEKKRGGAIEALIGTLSTEYGVSREVAAWQIRNSGVAMSSEEKAFLRELVSHPERF